MFTIILSNVLQWAWSLSIFVAETKIIVPLFCRKKLIISCPKCGEEISLDDCFKDKAVENELKTAIIKCTNQDCPWEGPGQYYKVAKLCDVVVLSGARGITFPACIPRCTI